MRRYLTLIFLLCLAIPAGISISGCIRNPAGNYCNGLGYGLKDTQTCIRLSCSRGRRASRWRSGRRARSPRRRPRPARELGQRIDVHVRHHQQPDCSTFRLPATCAPGHGTATRAAASPTTPSAIFPIPLPSTGGLPYATAYHHGLGGFGDFESGGGVCACAGEFDHSCAPGVGRSSATSQGAVTQLDSEACYVGANNTAVRVCAPPTVDATTPARRACRRG